MHYSHKMVYQQFNGDFPFCEKISIRNRHFKGLDGRVSLRILKQEVYEKSLYSTSEISNLYKARVQRFVFHFFLYSSSLFFLFYSSSSILPLYSSSSNFLFYSSSLFFLTSSSFFLPL